MRATKPPGGIFQRVSPHGVWYARRVVPAELRQSGLPRELVRSLGTTEHDLALHRSRDISAEFDAAIRAARATGGARPWTLETVIITLEQWHHSELMSCAREGAAYYLEIEEWDHRAPMKIGFNPEQSDLSRALTEAKRYFEAFPSSSREVGMPAPTAILLSRLESALREPSRWVEVPGLDKTLDEAFAAQAAHRNWLQTTYYADRTDPSGAPGDAQTIPDWARERARTAFIPLYLDAVRTWEWERSRHAAVMVAVAAVSSIPANVQVKAEDPAYVHRPGDKLFSELVSALLTSRADKTHRYRGIIAALEEVVGPDRPIRAITKSDIKAALAFVRRIPKNAKKFWPDLTLSEAVAKADAEGKSERLSPGSVSTYFSHLCSLFTYAVNEDWLDASPCAGIQVEGEQITDRRAFDAEELQVLFDDFHRVRSNQPAKFWVPALALFTGARQNELCQLMTSDVQEENGVTVLHLTKYDEDGVNRGSKRLKNDSSTRFVPIHSELLAAGFRDYVDERKAAGDERLFPQLTEHATGHGHYFGKWFGRRLRTLGILDKSACFHSYRHGWREAASLAGMTDRQVDAMAGWSPKSQAGKYGRRTVVKELAPLVEKIDFGDFRLPGSRERRQESGELVRA